MKDLKLDDPVLIAVIGIVVLFILKPDLLAKLKGGSTGPMFGPGPAATPPVALPAGPYSVGSSGTIRPGVSVALPTPPEIHAAVLVPKPGQTPAAALAGWQTGGAVTARQSQAIDRNLASGRPGNWSPPAPTVRAPDLQNDLRRPADNPCLLTAEGRPWPYGTTAVQRLGDRRCREWAAQNPSAFDMYSR